MVNFRATNKRLNRSALGIAGFLAVLLIAKLILDIDGVANFANRIESQGVQVGTGIGNGLACLTQSSTSYMVALQSCEANNRQLVIEHVDYAELKRQVLELQALLQYTQQTGAAGTTARIIARALDDKATHVIIDKGKSDGLAIGSAVVIDNGILYGIVEDIKATSAVVRLLANEQSKIPAAVLGENRTIGLVEGREGAVLVMEFIPQEASLSAGDMVVTSGLDGRVPEGLVIGLIAEVVTVQSAPFKRAYIELLYDPREWTTVVVLPPSGV